MYRFCFERTEALNSHVRNVENSGNILMRNETKSFFDVGFILPFNFSLLAFFGADISIRSIYTSKAWFVCAFCVRASVCVSKVCVKRNSVTILSWSTLAGSWLFIYHHFLTVSLPLVLFWWCSQKHRNHTRMHAQIQFKCLCLSLAENLEQSLKNIGIGTAKEHKTQAHVDEIYRAFEHWLKWQKLWKSTNQETIM